MPASSRSPWRDTRSGRYTPFESANRVHSQPPPPSIEPSNEARRVTWGRRDIRGPSPGYSRTRTSTQPAASRLPAGVRGDASKASTLDPASEQLYREELQPGGHTPAATVHGSGPRHTHAPEPLDGAQTQRVPSFRLGQSFNTGTFETQNPSPRIEQSLLAFAGNEQQRDDEVCRRVHLLRAQIFDFAEDFVRAMPKRQSGMQDPVDRLCDDVRNRELIRFIGCLALAGPQGMDSWESLLADEQSLKAVLIGIIGAVLKEHVFSALWFGGTPANIKELQELQTKQKDRDGYERTKSRAECCIRFKDTSKVADAEKWITRSLEVLLAPLFGLNSREEIGLPASFQTKFFDLVGVASKLSREMRQCGDVIFHWPQSFKDDEFDPERMECLNIASMISNSPYVKESVQGHDRSVLKGPQEKAEAIVQVVVFPGLVVHRQGGGALAKTLLEKEANNDRSLPPDVQRSRRMGQNGREYTGEEGFRTRVICKSVVQLIWGKQRLLTKAAGTSAHLDAMRDNKMDLYTEDRSGCIELFDHFMNKNAGVYEL